MTAEKYVKMISKRVMCSGKKRKDIQKQLLSEIEERVSGGEKPEEVMAQMGSIGEIAESFNENISDGDKKIFKKRRLIKAVIVAAAVLTLILGTAYWILPKASDISSSEIFTEPDVRSVLMDTIDMLDAGDYQGLSDNAASEMKKYLQKHKMEEFKNSLCANWGDRKMMGEVYMQEVIQMNKHYATCQVNVTYENVSVVYTISFDRNLKIAGLYMK